MAYSFILTDLYGVPHGEVTQASARKVTLPHLRLPGATFTMPLWHALSPTVLDTDCLLQVWRTDPLTAQRDLVFHGPVVSAEENADATSQSVSVTAAGPFWRLTKRVIPGSMLTTGIGFGSEAAKVDLGLIARQIITDVNGAQFTGIDPSVALGTHVDTISGFVSEWRLKNAAEGIAELSAGLSSFEYRVRPTPPTAYSNAPANWPRIGLLDTMPMIGSRRDNAIFEYGTARGNVASYKRPVSRESLLTRAYISSSGWPDGGDKDAAGNLLYPLLNRDADNINTRGLFEEVVNDAGILDNTLRTDIADLHLAVRKNPRQQITFSPVTNARPAPFVDYNVGDEIRARAFVRGILRFDAWFRIWGVNIDISENGDENVELELVQP